MRGSLRLSALLSLPALAVAYAACSDGGPVDPTIEAPPPVRAISDAVHGGGNEHFFWLPPVVGEPGSFTAPFDPTKSPVVTICDLAACNELPIAEFSMTTGPGSETVRLELANEHYIVNWHTTDFDVQPGPTYRLEVLVGGTLLGYADVQLASNGKEAKNLTTNEIISLKDGRTLPIKFRIEEGAVFVVTAEEGGTVEALEGSVKLEVPAGALTEETGITVEPAEDPSGTSVSVVDFGPDGLTFEEPVPVTLSYDPVQLPAGVAEEDLALNLLVEGRWIVLPGGSVDPINKTVTTLFHHFSTGGVGPAELALYCPGAPDSFDSMQEAVWAVMDGGTVEVCDGTHPVEGVVVDHPVNIVAAAGASPVLQTATELAAFWVDGYSTGTVVIDGLEFEFDTPTGPDIPTRSYAIRAQNTYDQLVVRNSIFTVDPAARGGIFTQLSSVSGSATLVETSRFGGGVYGITSQDGHLDVTASQFLGVGSVGILYFGSTNASSGRVEDSTFDDCGSRYCVWAYDGSNVEVVSNDFTTPTPTGDSAADLLQVLRFAGGATVLVDNNDFDGCGYHRCILGASGASLTVTNNRFVLPSGGGANANPEHAVMIFHPDVTADVQDNQITGCWVDCIAVQPNAVATIRGNTMTIPTGSEARFGILGTGGVDPGPGLFANPADAPVLMIEDNVIQVLATPGDPADPSTYELAVGIWLDNATATVSGTTIEGAATGIASMEAADITGGQDNVIQTTWVAIRTNSIGADDSFDDGRATLRFSDITDHANAIWMAPGDASSDLTCNYWGGMPGEEPIFLHDNTAASSVYAPWALMPIAGMGATDCAPAEIRVAAADDGSGLPFVPTVAAAVALVAPDGVVHVSDGTHSVEGVFIDRPMTIQAEGAGAVLQTATELATFWVDGYSTGTVVIDGLEFDFDTPTGPDIPTRSYAIRAQNTYDQLVIRNSTFTVDPAARGGIFTQLSSVSGSATLVETSWFGGGVYGITSQDGHLDVTASQFLGVGSVGILYFGSTNASSGRVEDSTFDDCGSRYCVWAYDGSNVEVVSNDFTTPTPTGDSAADLLQVLRFAGGATVLVDNNDFDGCGYHRCILGASGASLTVTNNRFVLPSGGGANANPEHAVMIFHPAVTADVQDNQITGCWAFCVTIQPNVVATIRGNTMTIPAGDPLIAAAIFGNGGADFNPGSVPDPADAPLLLIEDNVVEALGTVGDISNVGDYQINYGVWLQNAVATSVSGNTIRRATVGFRVLENAEIQAGQDNVVETAVWAVQTSHIFGDGVEQPEDDGRVVMHESDFLDYHNSIWGRPGDTTSDLSCNYWGTPTGAPGSFTNDGMANEVYTPWATAPIANGAGGACDGMPLAEVTADPANAGSDPAVFATLTEAVDAVAEDGTVNLAEGTHLVDGYFLPKRVTIQADPGAVSRPIVQGSTDSPVLWLDNLGPGAVILRGFEIQGVGTTNVYVTGTTGDVLLDDMHFNPGSFDFSRGVWVDANASSVIVQNSTFTGGNRGVHVDGGGGNVSVLNNTFEGQQEFVVQGVVNEFSGNTVLTCVERCLDLFGPSGPMVLNDNHITVDPSHPDQPTPIQQAIWATNTQQLTMAGNVVEGLGGSRPIEQVIWLQGVNDATLTGNTVSGANGFVAVSFADAVTASDNVVSAGRMLHDFNDDGTAYDVHTNDITGWGTPFSGPDTHAAGGFTCNWWGTANGPAAGASPEFEAPPASYEPWATGPVAGGAGGACDGVHPMAVTVDPVNAGSDPSIVATFAEAAALVAEGGTVTLAEGTHPLDGEVHGYAVPKAMTVQGDPGAATTPVLQGFNAPYILGILNLPGSVTLRGFQIEGADPGSQNVYIEGTVGDVLMEDMDFVPGTGFGVWAFEADASSIVVQGSRFTGGDRGVQVDGPNANVSVLGNQFEGQQAFVAQGHFTAFSNNTLLTCPNDCLQFNTGGSALEVNDNQITVDPSHPDQAPTIGTVVRMGNVGQLTMEGNIIAGLGGGRPIEFQVVLLHGVDDAVFNGNTVSGTHAMFYAFEDVGSVTGSDNVVTNAFRTFIDDTEDGTVYSLHDNDFVDMDVPFTGVDADPAGSMTCNWWGSALGPTANGNPGFVADSASYTPWATGPIANGAGGACDGGS